MKIAINGSLGSGKSTVAKALAKKMDYTYISTGAWFRKIAEDRGLTLEQLGAMAESDLSIDAEIDSRLKALNDVSENMIIDSRMAAFFIKDAFKIRLTVSEEEGAARIWMDDKRGPAESFSNFSDAIAAYRKRSNSERKRYLEAYGVDVEADGSYDLLLDSTGESVESITQKIELAIASKR